MVITRSHLLSLRDLPIDLGSTGLCSIIIILAFREVERGCHGGRNSVARRAVAAGYSEKLRHLKRTHRVSSSSVKEQLDRPDVELSLVESDLY